MYGGLKRTASRLALVAAAGVLSTSAYAADLGGDCCADLEERVAELEATTARKGNRKVSLTISGQVNKQITSWSAGAAQLVPTPAAAGQIFPGTVRVERAAGRDSGTYLGLDNTNSSTRFGFAGSAKVTPTVSAGFSLLIDVTGGARSGNFSQLNEDSAAQSFGANAALVNTFNNDYGLRLRDANWWLESSQLGRLTVGRLVPSGAVNMIDLGGISMVGGVSHGLVGGSLVVANQRTMNDFTDNGGDFNPRGDGVKYTSPTLAGFVFSAAIIETLKKSSLATANSATLDGQGYGVDLKYAGEFSGIRLAAGIGYELLQDGESGPIAGSPLSGAGTAADKVVTWGGSLALLHVATGLFLQGDYINKEKTTQAGLNFDANRWNIQGGISQNFFGVGKTNLYGEYGRGSGWLEVNSGGAGLVAGVDSRYNVWGLGVVQNLDAAAMELFAGYRAFKFEEGGDARLIDSQIKQFTAGARIKF